RRSKSIGKNRVNRPTFANNGQIWGTRSKTRSKANPAFVPAGEAIRAQNLSRREIGRCLRLPPGSADGGGRRRRPSRRPRPTRRAGLAGGRRRPYRTAAN